jgi:hypothetical protein
MNGRYAALVSVDRDDDLCLRLHPAMLALEVLIVLSCFSLLRCQVLVKQWLKLLASGSKVRCSAAIAVTVAECKVTELVSLGRDT